MRAPCRFAPGSGGANEERAAPADPMSRVLPTEDRFSNAMRFTEKEVVPT